MALMGQMMSAPLLISSIIKHAARYYGSTEIVSRRTEGDLHRHTYRDCELRARKLAQALGALGVKQGERVGTLAWNGYRHLEVYYGVSGMGAVCHTVNPRLFPEQIAYIVNHAEDGYIFFDLTFLPLVEGVAPHCPNVRGWVAMTDRAHMPAEAKVPLLCYEELLEAQDGNYQWPQFDENLASSLCYTSGTTGNPKGALYSHRSTVLHSYASAMPDALGCSASDVILPVVPMFHVNAWGLPYSVPLVGAKLVLPGPKLDGASLYELFEQEQVTFSAGVPTVWLGLLQHVQANQLRFSTFRRTVIGGSAAPPAMIRALEAHDVEVIHAWGMTEMSPLGTASKLLAKHHDLPDAERHKIQEKQGRVIYGVDMKIIDGEGKELPWDGKAFGDLLVRGPWIIDRYFRNDASPLVDGWFPTGDVATIDADGFMQITDRSKDVIKSGGEWISSIDIENVAAAHPAVHMAACISAYHPKWDERPLLVVVKKPGAEVSREELLQFFEGKVAKWWIPDDVAFVTEIPLTATGKMQKLRLREQFKDYKLPTA
ncbi:3-(methylthio)propionyl-CoA ligase [Cupriavidus taiwanensis]|uniref:3-(methylthio)propionyl-CoA ligase n=1 Tax=Cupriavidus taiwanensis TaxID=164546 RepID=UPI000E102404|nr:3-(methylthio)propionyl-CoA ligase [Cupriavidus taiwanensis]SOY43487.1 Medium-chain-fatty-acid-CoA ligase (Medium-chain acyl- CoA synthetase) [Cupriavidus taiwanensis]SOY59253.1 Medium-chain-fatty-acid-CoA ligase (Medium-chain acyl- CoA synthetase) [Cupriavidus taiwanensis]SOY80213.1 Medium-chain-fatty-acid-CoA ligase (Medium-chain acyl- CoA synthetase) [Cupriavidus taiwanensis]SOZ51386.1 Medium-chain-fatty-acid-CoA ligase (Medium-chain acyl- CoA synthetase) [Cupriavidus taiwanensis]SOZ7627